MTAPSVRASIVEARTYLRPIDEENGIFETPEQAAERIIGHQRWLWQRAKAGMTRTIDGGDWAYEDLTADEEAELQELKALFLARKVTFSGRTRWLGGTDIGRSIESTMFNCAALEVRSIHDVVDVLWLLLQGCGVGFRPVVGSLNGFTKPVKVEVVRSTRTKEQKGREHNVEYYNRETKTWTISVGDSAVAWAKSVGKIMAGKFPADTLVFDFSQIRGAGGRLRNYGWISSGDEQIAAAYVKIAEIMNRRAGQLLSRIDILDIVNLLGTILSSRRSAEIAVLSFGEPEWEEFARAKLNHWENGNQHRAASNNSLLFETKPTKYQLRRIFKIMEESGGSEPGFFNAAAARKRAPWFSLTNPCVPGETPILTDAGYKPIRDLVGVPTRVWNGREWSTVRPFSTGVNPLVVVNLSDGTSLTCTPSHKWIIKPSYTEEEIRVPAHALVPGMRLAKFDMPIIRDGAEYSEMYSQGFFSGDGNTGYEFSWVYEPKFPVIERLCGKVSDVVTYGRVKWKHGHMRPKSFVPHDGDLVSRCEWFAGLCDADAAVVRDVNGNAIQLSSSDRSFLLEVRRMLTTMGVQAKISLMNHEGREFDGYTCRACYRLLVSSGDVHRLLTETPITFSRLKLHAEKPQRDARRFVTVVDVQPLEGAVETFCFTDPRNHTGTFDGIVTGNCGEILLSNRGFCNLVELVLPRFNGDDEALERAQYLLARANYRQTCVALIDPVLQRGWHENQEFLRLCGAGVTGVVSWEHVNEPMAWERLRQIAVNGANDMADELNMPRAKAVTTVKPSGTQSKAMGTVEYGEIAEGIHKPLGRYIFNNIRFSSHDPLVEKLRNANYRVFEDPYDVTGAIVTFPIEYKHIEFDTVNGVEVNVESAVSQLDRYKLLMDHYVDHNASITVSYSPDEVPAIIDWLMENWDHYVGVSFLYRNDPTKTAEDLGFPYLPQMVVSRETYEAYVSTILPVNLSDSGSVEMLDGTECASGACPVR